MARFSSVVVACLLLAASPLAGSPQSAEAAIRSAYATLRNAALKNDATALSRILAPNFQQRNADGSIEARAAYIQDETTNTPGLVVASLDLTVRNLAVRGDDARAQATYTFTGTYSSNNTATPFRGVRDVRDDWTVTTGGWKLRSRTLHEEISYVGGKIVEDNREQIAPSQPAIAELRKRAVIVPTLALDADPDQLDGIGKAIGDARIVGMGEGTHGSSEFFAFKNRLFKYLVERKGFTVFAMEAYWGAGLNVDRYIKGGRGTARQAVASLGFWTWNTAEVVNLIQWMHDYNAAPGKHAMLSFVGIDMQDPMGAIGYLAQYFRRHDVAQAGAARQALQCSADAAAHPDGKTSLECRRKVDDVGQQLATVDQAPDTAVAREAATNIAQFLEFAGEPGDTAVETRDRDMAANLKWVATEYPDAKIAVWAHNGHVGTTPELNYHPMGSYVRKAFGAAYYVIGQTFGSGTVRAFVSGEGLQPVHVPLNSGDTTAELFGPLRAVAFIDVRSLPAKSALGAFFATQHGVSEIGSMMDPAHPAGGMPMVVPKSFDGLVYVPTSTASVSAVDPRLMKREINDGGNDWRLFGLQYDDLTVSTTPTGATLSNNDDLNDSPSYFMRRFSARPYAGKTIAMTGEVRADDFLGYVLPFSETTSSSAKVSETMSRGNVVDITSGGWVPMKQTLKVPADAAFVEVGIMAEGFGAVEVRRLQVTPSTI